MLLLPLLPIFSLTLISLTQTSFIQYHSHSIHTKTLTLISFTQLTHLISNISSHTQSTHSIHSTHLMRLSPSHTYCSLYFSFTSIHLYHSIQSPTHTLPDTLACSFLDSQFGKPLYVGLSGPLIASNMSSHHLSCQYQGLE